MDYEVMTYKDLRRLGIDYSRSHIDRLQKRADDPFPMSFKLSKGRGARRVWWRAEVIDWLKERSR